VLPAALYDCLGVIDAARKSRSSRRTSSWPFRTCWLSSIANCDTNRQHARDRRDVAADIGVVMLSMKRHWPAVIAIDADAQSQNCDDARHQNTPPIEFQLEIRSRDAEQSCGAVESPLAMAIASFARLGDLEIAVPATFTEAAVAGCIARRRRVRSSRRART